MPMMCEFEHALQKEAAYWLAHANELAAKFRDAPGLTAMIGRQRARQAFRFYGRCMADIEKRKARLWF